jgi:ABC-type sugar transport system ATPase subunit
VIRTEGLGFSVGSFRLEGISLEVADGEYFALLGPPGSGKSVFLECLCGLNRAGTGRVFIDGRDMTGLEARRRGIGYVPQDYALFPHLSVEQNIASGLRARRRPRDQVRRRVGEVAGMLGIGHLLGRRIPGLSGGEKQRVALARAAAIEPRVLLLDEPVSALDEATRESVCGELRRLQRDLSISTIHISHNLEEAFSVADRGAVMQNGRVRQVGGMQELLRRPADAFVARFMRCENILAGRAAPGSGPAGVSRVAVTGAELLAPGTFSGEVLLVIRPENLHLARPNGAAGVPGCPGPAAELRLRLVRAVDRGAYVRARLGGALELVAHLPQQAFAELRAAEGEELLVRIHPEAVHVLTREAADTGGEPPGTPAGNRVDSRWPG